MQILILVMLFAAGLIAARAVRNIEASKMINSAVLIGALVAADQLIKVLVIRNYPECRGAIVNYFTFKIGDFKVFSLTHIRNNGAGWSILGGQTVFLSVFTAVVIVGLLVYLIIKRKKIAAAEWIAICLIIGGGLGNLIDRARMLIEGTDRFAGVIDYFKLEFISFPVFNFADCCVVLGCIIFCLVMIFEEISDSREKKKSKKLPAAAVKEEEKGQENDEPL